MDNLLGKYMKQLDSLKAKKETFTKLSNLNVKHRKIEKVNRKIANVEAIIARIETTSRIKFSDLLSKPHGVHTIVRAKMPWDEDEPEHPPAVDVDDLTDDDESGVDVDDDGAYALMEPTYKGVYYEGGRYHADFRIVQYKTIVAQVVFPLKPRVSVSVSVSVSEE
jgi:hypothetical protein